MVNTVSVLTRSHGLVVKADGSWPRGHGFKPWHRILYKSKQFASYYIKEKFENKGSQMGHTKKQHFQYYRLV
jgi:hypothetical protein